MIASNKLLVRHYAMQKLPRRVISTQTASPGSHFSIRREALPATLNDADICYYTQETTPSLPSLKSVNMVLSC